MCSAAAINCPCKSVSVAVCVLCQVVLRFVCVSCQTVCVSDGALRACLSPVCLPPTSMCPSVFFLPPSHAPPF